MEFEKARMRAVALFHHMGRPDAFLARLVVYGTVDDDIHDESVDRVVKANGSRELVRTLHQRRTVRGVSHSTLARQLTRLRRELDDAAKRPDSPMYNTGEGRFIGLVDEICVYCGADVLRCPCVCRACEKGRMLCRDRIFISAAALPPPDAPGPSAAWRGYAAALASDNAAAALLATVIPHQTSPGRCGLCGASRKGVRTFACAVCAKKLRARAADSSNTQ